MVTPTDLLRGADAAVDGARSVQLASRATSKSQNVNAASHSRKNILTNEQRAAAQALKADEAAHRATTTDKVITAGSVITGVGGLLSFIGPAALKIVSWPFKKIGELSGIGFITKIGENIRKPADYFTSKTVGDLGRDMGIDGVVGRGSQKIADGAAVLAEKADGALGFGKRRFAANFGKAEKHFSKAKTHIPNINLSEVHPDLVAPLKELQKHVQAADNVGHLHSQHYANSHTKVNRVGVVEDAVHSAHNNPASAVRDATVTANNNSFKANVHELEEAIAKINKAKGQKVASGKATMKAVNGLINEAGHVESKLGAANAWLNPAKAVKGMPGAIAKGNLAHVSMNSLFVGGSLFSMVQDLKGFFTENKQIKAMRADGVGDEAISMARKGTLKKLVLKQAADIANVALNVVQAVNHKFSMTKSLVAFGGAEAVSRFADNLTENNILPSYTAFKHAYLSAKASGQELPVDYYAAFIAEANKDMKSHGGIKNPHVQEVAKQLAEAKLTPAQIMNESSSGRLSQRLFNIIDANKAKAAGAAIQHPATERGSEVNKMQNHRHRKDMPVIGKHTHDVVNESTQPGLART